MHVGMIPESILPFSLFRSTTPSTLFVILFFILNVSDHVIGILTRIPETWVRLLFLESVIASLIFPPTLNFYIRRVSA
ncbi:MAG: hypothetical protein DRO89_00595 [Candidatus Altiarchaeales archaeon]|nr:MAG: hypothetical protein DRO89_00595 [Candidatus Altiarchaeales archaeon]